LEETRFEHRVEHGLLRNQLVADGVADRLRQLLTMARDHSLRPDREAEQFFRLIRMKEHPDREPRCAKAVDRPHDYPEDGDYDLVC
jgi:hypothetical protein